MMPTADRLLHLSHDLAQPTENAARQAALKGDAAEITARVRGCLDAAETLRAERELGQALPYYEAACEFSALVEAVGETVPALAPAVEGGCAGARAARGQLHSPAFVPQLFHDLAEQARADAAAEAAPAQPAAEMVFSMSDL
jgi:hypothetical protein